MAEQKLFRAEPDDPNRCQSTGAGGQCPYLAAEGSTHCVRHGANTEIASIEKAKANQYRLQIWQQRVDEFSDSPEIVSLRGEIGILRLLVEEMLRKCTDANELVMYSSKLSELISKIERVTFTCAKLESNMGLTLDRAAALNFAEQIVTAISQHVKDTETIDLISNDIINALATLTKKV